ncbi:spore germination protein KC [Peribacillus deserti]|uniref:Spore germination protein KC n=1 Tax=Peribacillus deserti TaxID=673318 RepID=A0ABS2QN49_9BACI|nr:Ger(x)C family spore germination protein [Peribacillus deserti]MBM7693701.1 spore germination protein KC [Peribacillus deserti]
MKRKCLVILVLFMFTHFLGGCSNYRELRDAVFIAGLGIDWIKEKKRYEITFQAFSPTSTAGTGSAGAGSTGSVLYTAEGRTISEAARQASKKFSRMPDYSHVRIVVIGDDLAKAESLNYIFDVFERDANIRANIPALIARGTSAKEVLSVIPATEHPVQSINGKVRNSSKMLGENEATEIYQIINQLTSTGTEPTIGGISVITSENPTQPPGTKETKLRGMGIIKEGKLVGWLDGTKSKSILFLNNQMRQTNESINCGGHRYTSVRITSSKSKIKVHMNTGKPEITIHVDALGIVDEMLCNRKIMEYDVLHEYEKKTAGNIAKHIQDGINEAKKQKSDIFGFGDILHRQHPEEWKKYESRWHDVFAKSKVSIHVNFILHGTSMRVEPYPYK